MTTDRITFRTMTFGLVGFLFLVELTSGILQGYYVPLASKIAGHLGVDTADYNWTEAAQLLLSALVVPVLAKLGDMFGHKRILLASTAVTALASWGMVASRRLRRLPDRLRAAGLLRGLAAARGRADLRPRPPHRQPARRTTRRAAGLPGRGARGRRHPRRAGGQPGVQGDRRELPDDPGRARRSA